MIYAGIGNRYNVPVKILDVIKSFAELRAKKDYILRTGGAVGCDQAFEEGHRKSTDKNIELYLPWPKYENRIGLYPKKGDAYLIAESFYKYDWANATNGVKKMMARNAMIVLGENLKTPIDFLLCYATDEEKGGTAHSIRIARSYGIQVVNLAKS